MATITNQEDVRFRLRTSTSTRNRNRPNALRQRRGSPYRAQRIAVIIGFSRCPPSRYTWAESETTNRKLKQRCSRMTGVIAPRQAMTPETMIRTSTTDKYGINSTVVAVELYNIMVYYHEHNNRLPYHGINRRALRNSRVFPCPTRTVAGSRSLRKMRQRTNRRTWYVTMRQATKHIVLRLVLLSGVMHRELSFLEDVCFYHWKRGLQVCWPK